MLATQGRYVYAHANGNAKRLRVRVVDQIGIWSPVSLGAFPTLQRSLHVHANSVR